MRYLHSLSARLQLLVTTIIVILTAAMLWLLVSALSYEDRIWDQRVERVNEGWQTLQQATAGRVTRSLKEQFEAEARDLMLRGRTRGEVADAVKEGSESAFGDALFGLQTLPDVPANTRFGAYDLEGTTDNASIAGSLNGDRTAWMDSLIGEMMTLTGPEAIEGVTGFTLIEGQPFFTAAGLVHTETREDMHWQGAFGVAIPMEGFLAEVRNFLSTDEFPAALAVVSPDGEILRRQGELDSQLSDSAFTNGQGGISSSKTRLIDDGRLARTLIPLQDADGTTKAYLSAVTSMATIHSVLADRSRLEAAKLENEIWGGVIALLVLALGSGAFFWVARQHLQRPIQALRAEMARIAENDLSHPVAQTEATEVGDLQAATEDMRITLNSQ
ncbi:HAMP domain-containing protein, partial [Thiohalorhabdus sp.]|uniref:HAMP domain-containing protein n=1 Tax=Thiohalorhabdus sp. TaxID=3094134 RepID=UPI002FC324FB